jgi:O-methyltransferase involved in polyketide biosynthesis
LVSQWYALDVDKLAVAHVASAAHSDCVVPIHASVRDLLSQAVGWSDLNLVYASGLYDYLTQRTATRLTARLFAMLAPGGRLAAANFAPDPPNVGYTEACMDWWLVYRSEADMMALADEVPANEVESAEVLTGDAGIIQWLTLRKAV